MGEARLDCPVRRAADVLRRLEIAVADRQIDNRPPRRLQPLDLCQHHEGTLREQPLHPLRELHHGSNTTFTPSPSCRRAARNALSPRDSGTLSTHGSVRMRPSENHWMPTRISASPAPYDPL